MERRDRRGQLLLVAALGLAVAFVVLALVLNAVVFTENLATRNHGQTDDVVGFERAVERGAGGLVAEVNYHENADYETLRDALAADVATWDGNASVLGAAHGRVTAASLAGVENGTQVVQSVRRNFTNATGAPDWTAAAGVNETRRFHAVVDPSATDSLTVTVTDGTSSWSVSVAENGSWTDVTVAEDGTQVASYEHPAETVELDLTQGTVNGTQVANWTFADGVSAPYDVAFRNGDVAEGRYVFVVDRPRTPMLDDLPEGTYNSRTSGDYPTTAPALYSATVDVSVLNDRVSYETSVTAAPGAPPDGVQYDLGGGSAAIAPGIVFVDDDTGNLLWATRTETATFDVTDATVLGPMWNDFDGDARLEVPYVNSSGAMRLVDTANRSATWRTGSSTYPPAGAPSRLGVGEWQATDYSVLYAGSSGSRVFAAENASGPSTELHSSGDGVSAVAGVADVDGDGADELVFGDGSQQLRYRDDDGTEVKIANGGFGQNGSVGIGTPVDFDGDGTARVPFVDGSNNLKLVDGAGNVETLVDSSNVSVSKAPVAVDDWDDDGRLEIVFVSGGDLWYVDDVAGGGTPVEITADLDGDGSSGVDVDTTTGVA
ncbi:MAG: FG-GAP repeat domain-containing protein [Halobacterium sp.]